MRKVMLCLCVGVLCSSMLLAGPPSSGVSADRSQATAVRPAIQPTDTTVSAKPEATKSVTASASDTRATIASAPGVTPSDKAPAGPNGPPPGNDNCVDTPIDALAVPGQLVYDGDNTDATPDAPCLGWPAEVWFAWTQGSAANITIDLCDSATYFSTVGVVYVLDCPCTAYYFFDTWDWNCGNPTLYKTNMPAGTYYYPLYSPSDLWGPYTLKITASLPPAWACCIGIECVGDYTQVDCLAMGGAWYADQTCDSFICPETPANDNCADAFSCDLPVPGQCIFEGDNSAATVDCAILGAPEVWFKWTTVDLANITIDLCDSSTYFGTLYIVYLIDCPCTTYLFVSGYDWNCGNPTAYIFGMAAGTYYYPMYSAAGNTGPYILKITAVEPPPPPPNDNCEDALACDLPVPGQCIFEGDNSGATADCLLLGWPEVWFKWTTVDPADITVDLCDSATYFATVGIVYTLDCPCSALYWFNTWDWNCGNPTLYAFGLPAGTYYYPMYSAVGYIGPYVLKVTAVAPPMGACCIGLDCIGTTTKQDCQASGGHWFADQNCDTFECPPPPPYDFCDDPFTFDLNVGFPVVWTGDNTGASEECALLSGGAYRDLWAKFTTTQSADVKIDYCTTPGPFYNAYIVFDTACPCTGAWVFASTWENSTCGDGNWSLYWFGLPAGTYYWPLLTDSTYGYCEGPFTVTFTATGPPPPPECPADSIFNQGPPYMPNEAWAFNTSAVSTAFTYKCYDNFWDVSAPICDVHWWGLILVYNAGWYLCDDPSGITWSVQFYDGGSGGGGSGNCCYDHGGPGCEDPVCEASVCGYDPYCCDVYWDSICVGEANSDPNCDCGAGDYPGKLVCDYEVTPTITDTGILYAGFYPMQYFEADLDPCCELATGVISIQSIAGGGGPPPSGNCCYDHGGPGCEDPVCEASVCSYDPYCCDTYWDSICISEANSDPNCDCGAPECVFLWATGPNGDGVAYQDQGGVLVPTGDYAFCLTPGGVLCGDANCDGEIDNFDIDAFVMALTDLPNYMILYGCLMNCDTNCDLVVDNFDIDSFVYAITNGECESPPCK